MKLKTCKKSHFKDEMRKQIYFQMCKKYFNNSTVFYNTFRFEFKGQQNLKRFSK